MNSKYKWIGLALVALSVLAGILRLISPQALVWQIALLTPVQFYGKVVDEKGIPIQQARALVSLHDHLLSGGTEKKCLSDKDGLFSVWGVGIGLGVNVSKDGYYRLKESCGTFGYAAGAGTGAPHRNPRDPAIFILRKMGNVEPLIQKALGGSLAKNGEPTEMSFQSEQQVSPGKGDVRIECWTNDQGIGPNSNAPFDWKCRISANGGGVVERKGKFDFEAPVDGYQQSFEINMPKSLGEKWQDFSKKEFFLRLNNGCFARIRLMMNAGGEQTFCVIGYLNPRPGSRNLERGPEEEQDPR